MKENKNSQKRDGLRQEFDSWAKKTIENIVDTVIRDYLADERKRADYRFTDFENVAAPRKVPDFEKVSIKLGTSEVLFEDENLADGITNELNEIHRKILECVYVLDMPEEMVADLLDLKTKTIFNYKYKALGILRKYMEGNRDE